MKVPFTNEGKTVVHIGNVTVMPGHTRDVEEHDIPDFKSEVPAEKEKTDPLAEFLLRNVKDVVAALAGLSLAEVERLGELEQLGQKRKGVLNAIAETLLVRASQDEMLSKVGTLSDEELAAALEEAKTDIGINPAYLAALKAEHLKRNPAAAE